MALLNSAVCALSAWTTCGRQACLVVECKIKYTCQKHCKAKIDFLASQRHLFEVCPVDFVERIEIYRMVPFWAETVGPVFQGIRGTLLRQN